MFGSQAEEYFCLGCLAIENEVSNVSLKYQVPLTQAYIPEDLNPHLFHSFIPLARAESDNSLPFSGSSSIPLCYVLYPATLLNQLFFRPPSLHLAIYRVRQKYLTNLQNSCEWNRWRGEFVLERSSSETQSIAVAMECWSEEHRAFAVETYFKNNDSVLTQRIFRRHFNIHRNECP
jgi:hypothetical protein